MVCWYFGQMDILMMLKIANFAGRSSTNDVPAFTLLEYRLQFLPPKRIML